MVEFVFIRSDRVVGQGRPGSGGFGDVVGAAATHRQIRIFEKLVDIGL